MTPEETIAYCDRRLAALEGGPDKMRAFIAADPGSVRVAVWEQRIVEYERSLEGLALRKRLAEIAIEARGDTVEGEG